MIEFFMEGNPHWDGYTYWEFGVWTAPKKARRGTYRPCLPDDPRGAPMTVLPVSYLTRAPLWRPGVLKAPSTLLSGAGPWPPFPPALPPG
jgi:hypothetical protein